MIAPFATEINEFVVLSNLLSIGKKKKKKKRKSYFERKKQKNNEKIKKLKKFEKLFDKKLKIKSKIKL